MYKHTYIKFFFIIALLLSSSTVFATVKAYLNQITYFDGDPITLTIETNKNNNAQPDLSPLQKHFDILGTSASSQINILNSKRSFKKTWTIELQPKTKGEIKIPIIQVGKDKTEALTLTVIDLPPEIKAETEKHVFIESSVGIANNETYVQQQIPFTVKLFYDSAMVSGEITPFKIDNTVTEQLGRERRYRTTRSGKKFNVIEKNFVISPEKSGTLRIPPTMVKGRIALSGGDSSKLRKQMDETDMLNRFFNDFRNDPFFNDFGGGFLRNRSQGPSKPFTASSEAIDVNVLPVPAAFTGSAWLPAEELTIKDSWAKNPPELKAGVPVTRTLLLQAKGLAGSQIPEITIPKPTGMKFYPEPIKSETRTDGKTVYGIQQLDISYIPNIKGKISIPEIKVDWWNIKTKQQQTFTVPKWNLNVAAGAGSQSINQEGDFNKLPNTDEEKSSDVIINPAAMPSLKTTWDKTTWLALGFFGLIATILAYWIISTGIRRYKKSSQLSSHKKTKQLDLGAIQKMLTIACDNNEKNAAAKALIKLAQAQLDDNSIQSLGILASRLRTGENIIKELEQSLYSPSSTQWHGKALKDLVAKGLQPKQENYVVKGDGLAPLYPI